jgi:dipeptidyl aminopeptidase/acylaminoacyl peptidase
MSITPNLITRWVIGAALFLCIMPAAAQGPPVTIEDLATITRVRNLQLSPDGQWVVYLTLKPILAENKFDCAFWLQRTEATSSPLELARFQTTAAETYFETGELRAFGGKSAWSPDSSKLAYTSRVGNKAHLRVRNLSGDDILVAEGFVEIEPTGWRDDADSLSFKAVEENPKPSGSEDPSVRVTNEQNFWSLSWAKSAASATKSRAFQYKIRSRDLVEINEDGQQKRADILPATYRDAKWPAPVNSIKYVLRPILSPDKKYAVFTGAGMYENRDPQRASRDYFVGIKTMAGDSPPREFLHTTEFLYYFQWRGDSKQVYGVRFGQEHTDVIAIAPESGEVREIVRTDGTLWDATWDKDGSSFVATRQGTFMPDELVKFDLKTRRFDVLANPNAAFAGKDRPEVRFMKVDNPLGGGIFGRLVLPNGYVKGKRYPLIFTTYRAGPGFLEGAVGDEFPIFPFAANGFAVFAMDTGQSNMLSDSGDLEFTLMRARRPLEAMMMLREQLAKEGVVDPERCGITGLSYGSDITAFALATTHVFKAAATSSSGLDSIGHTLNSVNREKALRDYGMPYPDDAGRDQWRKMSLALNAERVTTPLLIQSSDSEAMFSLETFKALKHYGVPVEWYVYLNEGHQKFQPQSKYRVYQRNLDWFNFWLQGKEDPDPGKAEQYARWREMRSTGRK